MAKTVAKKIITKKTAPKVAKRPCNKCKLSCCAKKCVCGTKACKCKAGAKCCAAKRACNKCKLPCCAKKCACGTKACKSKAGSKCCGRPCTGCKLPCCAKKCNCGTKACKAGAKAKCCWTLKWVVLLRPIMYPHLLLNKLNVHLPILFPTVSIFFFKVLCFSLPNFCLKSVLLELIFNKIVSLCGNYMPIDKVVPLHQNFYNTCSANFIC